MKSLTVSASLALLLACSSPTGITSGELAVRAAPPGLELTNHSSAPVYSFAIDRGAAAYTDWAPCTNPTACSAIGVGATSSVPYAQIAGYSTASKEAIVYWWHLVADSKEGYRIDSLRAVVTTL